MSPDLSWSALLRPGWSDRFFSLLPLPVFRPWSRSFCYENAWWLCELSRLIYRQEMAEIGPGAPVPNRNSFLEQAGFREVFTLCGGTNFCAVVMAEPTFHDPFAALIFRGTCGFEGWLSNLNAVQIPWPWGGSVHRGFRDDFIGLWDQTAEFLNTLDIPLFYAGHSLGGALALLAASILPPQAVYTFGAPRTGDAIFAHSLSRIPAFRIELPKDIVTTVPPSIIPFYFDHPGTHVSLSPIPASDQDSGGRFSSPPEFLSSHAPINYTAMIEARLKPCSHPS